jgi:hypothetical protein
MKRLEIMKLSGNPRNLLAIALFVALISMPMISLVQTSISMPMISLAPSSVGAEGARIWTDKLDYSPGETVYINGTGFTPNTMITVNVTRPDGHVDSSLDQGTDVVRQIAIVYGPDGRIDPDGSDGCFTATYQLDGITGTYNVTATDGTNTATTNFTDTNYKITFQLSGISSDIGGTTTVLTTDSSQTWSYNQLTPSKQFSWGGGDTHSVAASTPISTSPVSTKQYRFSSWTNGDGLSGASGTYTVPYSDQTVTANYVTQYRVSYAISPFGSGGTSPSGTNVWTDAGALLISAIPNPGYVFSSWSSSTGSITFAGSTSSSTTATIGGTGTITANFVASDTTPPDTSITAGPTGWIKVLSATFSWTGSDDVTAAANLVYSWKLDAGAWSVYSSATSTTLTGLTEASHTFYVRAKDEAGNVDPTPAARSFSVDITAPTLTKGLAGTLGTNEWYTSNVVVTLTGGDTGGSGVASVEYNLNGVGWTTYTGPFTISTEGTNTLEHRITDNAGNGFVLASQTIKIDKTDPTLVKGLVGTPGLLGWFKSDVEVTLTGGDLISGLDRVEYKIDAGVWTLYSGFFTMSDEGTHTLDHRAFDVAGRNYTLPSQTIKIDKTAPVITITVPVASFNYILKQNVLAAWTATDAVSGLASAVGTVPSGSAIDTNTVGTKTFTVTATDNAGNVGTLTVTYYVRYLFSGILPPINPDGSSIFKLGSTVPVKFSLRDANGAYITNAVATITVWKLFNGIPFGSELEAESTSAATTGNLFRTADSQYIFNLATKPLTAGTWLILIHLGDGTIQSVIISLKK